MKTILKLLITVASCLAADGAQSAVPDGFPQFLVPGKEREMESLRALFWLHYEPAQAAGSAVG